jgi:hypothetical protein
VILTTPYGSNNSMRIGPQKCKAKQGLVPDAIEGRLCLDGAVDLRDQGLDPGSKSQVIDERRWTVCPAAELWGTFVAAQSEGQDRDARALSDGLGGSDAAYAVTRSSPLNHRYAPMRSLEMCE